jgi:acetyl esterase/lipase
MLPADIALVLRQLGQRFDPAVAQATRALAVPFHNHDGIAALPVCRDVVYGRDERQRLDVYCAAGSTLRPVVVFVHGGAFVGGDKTAADGAPFYENVASWALASGWACVAMTYRLAPAHSWPSGAQDVAAAIAWIHAHGAQYGLDRERIILVGQSAGAVHVAGYLAGPEFHQVRGGGVVAAALLSGLYDMGTAADNPPKRAYFGADAALYEERSSLAGLVAHCHIPLLLGVCERDPADFQAQALQLAQALFSRDQILPEVLYQAVHNHLSSIFLLGSSADTLGAPLAEFITRALQQISQAE